MSRFKNITYAAPAELASISATNGNINRRARTGGPRFEEGTRSCKDGVEGYRQAGLSLPDLGVGTLNTWYAPTQVESLNDLHRILQLNRFPFLLLNGSAASYLLFSVIRCSAFSGACPTGATSSLISLLGLPAWSRPLELCVPLLGSVWCAFCLPVAELSTRSSRICFFIRASCFAARSALISLLAK